MKPHAFLAAVIFAAAVSAAHAQSARQLTRKIVPPQSPAAPAAPARPTSPAAPAAPAKAAPPVTVTVPKPADPEKARLETEQKTVEFLKKRAGEGSASSQYDLGLRYLTGKGVEKDEALGRKWLEESAKNDYTPAKKKLEQLPPAAK